MSSVVTKAQAGVYRQITYKLRVQGRTDLNGPTMPEVRGNTPETNIRPRDEETGVYSDSAKQPTLLELREGDPVDVQSLLDAGGIAVLTPPATSGKGAG